MIPQNPRIPFFFVFPQPLPNLPPPPARDIQSFEMVPLGPALGKSSGTTISPWIVTTAALEPFKVASSVSRRGTVLPHLDDPGHCTYSVQMQVEILAGTGQSATVTGACDLPSSMYWSARQMVAHLASSGSAMRTGDVLATGTISGVGAGRRGCLLEATEGGTEPIRLGDGSTRGFLEDGDVVRMTGVAGDSSSGVGWGECVGRLVAARPF